MQELSFQPLISIIIPVFNGENYLKEAIDSALKQTYRNIEIIVVNDGSTDATESIAKSYEDKIQYFTKPNGGTSTALNVGIRHMRGEYFSWLSHDDQYYPQKIEREIQELESLDDKNTVIISDLDGIDQNYRKIYETDYLKFANEYPLRLSSPVYPIIYMKLHGCTLLIPRIAFDLVGLFDEKCLVAQDFELFYRVLLKFKYKYISDVLVTARDHGVRQGLRSKTRGSLEYSNLFVSIIESMTKEDMLLLAPTVLDFYRDMESMFEACGYMEALSYIRKRMLKNVQINYTDLAGSRFNGFDLHISLREKDIDSVQMVLRKDSNDSSTYLWAEPEYISNILPIIQNIEERYGTRALFSPIALDMLQSELFLKSNVIHFHIIHHPAFNIQFLPLMTRLKPSVWSIHDPWALTGHCVHPMECDKYETGCGDCSRTDSYVSINEDSSALNFALKKDIVQRSNLTIIVASKWMKDLVEKSPITAGKKIFQIPFGVNQQLFDSVDKREAKLKLGIDSDNLVLFCRADPGEFKGLDMIREALKSLKTAREIVILTVDQKNTLNEFSNKYSIIEYGWLNDNAILASLYQAADVFLMPSLAEAFGMMAVEAMSCGTMVLAVSGTSLQEVIDSPNCGITTDRNGQAYGRELQRLLDSPIELAERGRQSHEFAKKNYSYDNHVDKVIEVYKDVILGHKLNVEDEFLLEQLKKYTMRKPVNGYGEPAKLPSQTKTSSFYTMIKQVERTIRHRLKGNRG